LQYFSHALLEGTGSGELERVHDWTGACIENFLSFLFSFLPHFSSFSLARELERIDEWWMEGWESDDEMMDGLVFANVTAWRYVGDDDIRYGR
jgi:hypothetical protein